MARPPLPADQRRTEYVALRLTKAEAAAARAVAVAEHGGDLSAAIRALLAEALTARTRVASAKFHATRAERLSASLAALETGIREIHFPAPEYEDDPPGFCDSCRVMWPCPTAEALTARAQPTDQETR